MLSRSKLEDSNNFILISHVKFSFSKIKIARIKNFILRDVSPERACCYLILLQIPFISDLIIMLFLLTPLYIAVK